MRRLEKLVAVALVFLIIGGVATVIWGARADRDHRDDALLECARDNDPARCKCWIAADCEDSD